MNNNAYQILYNLAYNEHDLNLNVATRSRGANYAHVLINMTFPAMSDS